MNAEPLTIQEAEKLGQAPRRCRLCGHHRWRAYHDQKNRTVAWCQYCLDGTVSRYELETVAGPDWLFRINRLSDKLVLPDGVDQEIMDQTITRLPDLGLRTHLAWLGRLGSDFIAC